MISDFAEVTELNLDDELEAFMQARGHVKPAHRLSAAAETCSQARQGASGAQRLDSSTALLLGKAGVHVIKVEIDSDTPIALTGFILRCLSCSVMGELIEQGIVQDKALIEAAVDNELILRVAANIRSTLAARCSLHFPQSLSPFTKVWLSRALLHAQTLTPSRFYPLPDQELTKKRHAQRRHGLHSCLPTCLTRLMRT